MQPEISQATQSDIEAILPLLRAVHELHVLVEPKRYRSISDHELRINLQNHFHDDKLGCILVARSEQIVAGYLVLLVQTTPDSPFIYKKRFALVDQLGVNISIKRQGIGTALLNAAMSWCAGNGIESIELDVRASNMDAVAFYKACGFEPSNHRMVKSTTD